MLINIRFFRYDTDSEELDIVECGEGEFVELVEQGFKIEYERNTVRENGCAQVCLTVDNLGEC